MSQKRNVSWSQSTIASRDKKTRYAVAKKASTSKPWNIRMGRQPIPTKLYNTVKYVTAVSMTITAGIGNYKFIANGLFDPDFTAAGHQPQYFDQLTALYNHYTVLKSRIKWTTVLPTSATASVMAIYLDDDTTIVGNAVLAMEQPMSVGQLITSQGPAPPLRYNFDAQRVFGGNILDNDNLQGDSTANPNELQCFACCLYDTGGLTYSCQMLVEIEYDVCWEELKAVAQS